MSLKGLRRLGLASAASALCLALPVPKALAQTNSLCAVVKLEIKQQAALEREGFDAHLVIENNVIDQPLTNLKVQIYFKDAEGRSVDQSFFVKVATLTGTNAVDGTGVVQSSGTADIHWLIIPSSGTGGVNPAGQRYAVSALISSLSNGAPQSVTTFDALITVHPQPLIKLEYALPYEIFGDEPLTATIEPIEPFPLAARVTNVGYGPANSFQIDSAQPKITDNKQGLLVDFKLIGTQVGGKTIPNTLLIPFGDIQPGAVSQASWIMTATLSGRFISFTSTFTHAADLGGQLTSLMQSVATYTLLKDVLVDLPGRDQTPDYLVNESMDREAMQDLLNNGTQPPAEFILESDQAQPLPVAEVPGALSGSLGGTSAALTYTFTGAVSSNVWAHSYAFWPYGKSVSLAYAKRGDGKVLNAKNVWISKHFRKSDLATIYWINILDLTGSTNTYTLQFNPNGLDLPPGAVLDLAAATAAGGGSLGLTWHAPGEDGYSGDLFGAHVFLDAEQNPAAVFSPASAQVSFATSAVLASSQSYVNSSLAGNTTYYVALFTQDTGGSMSALSNLATAYTLPLPPTGLAISSLTSNSIAAGWQVGNNSLPIAYQVRLATAPNGPATASSPFQDSFTRTWTFPGLAPGTTYFVLGVGQNPVTGVTSPLAVLGSTVTLPSVGPQDAWPPRTSLLVGTPSTGSAPIYVAGQTTFSFLAVDDVSVFLDTAGTVAQTLLSIDSAPFAAISGTFSVAGEGLHNLRFYSTDHAGNSEQAHTATVAVDLTPPVTEPYYSGASTQDAQGQPVVGPDAVFELSAEDAVSSGAASGLRTTFYLIDQAPDACPEGGCSVHPFQDPFTLSPGTHTVYYYSLDKVGNEETVNYTALTVSTEAFGIAVSPSTGPIGIPFTIAGSGFGAYDGANTRVRFGLAGPVAPVSVWTDTNISGTVPGLSAGAYPVAIERQTGSTVTAVSAGTFLAMVPRIAGIAPAAAPIGVPFTVTGEHFGPYHGSFDRLLIGGAAVAVSVWNDTTITGTVPGLAAPGAQPLVVQRTTAGGGLMESANAEFTITVASALAMNPSTGPIGIPFTINGSSFGPYSGANTRVRFGAGGPVAPVTVWTDSTITGTIPGVSAGAVAVLIERENSGVVAVSTAAAFTVLVPSITAVVPSSGPIGITLTVTGASFGNYLGSDSRLLVGGISAPASLWTDEKIVGTVPGGVPDGQAAVVVQRTTPDGGLSESATAYFQLTSPYNGSISPSSGPIGIAFTITGASFGTYNGANTRVRFGSLPAPVNVWTGTSISGTVPGVGPGAWNVLVEIQQGSEVSVSTVGVFTANLPSIASFSPSSAPIGAPFTVTGADFGSTNGTFTRIKFNGRPAPVSVWNDTTITGTIPGVGVGSQPVVIERATADGGLAASGTFYFQVALPSATAVVPSSGPIGTAFTLTGASFGPYNGTSTVFKVGGAAASVSVWTDNTITGTIPGAAPSGLQPMVIERTTVDGGLAQSASVYFTVSGPALAGINPSTGPIGIPFTITGSNFGAYNGSNTRVKFGATLAPVSVWNDTAITGAVPGILPGTCDVVVERQEGSIVSHSAPASFTATLPQIASMTPSSGPIGVPFTLAGTSFGPYNGSNTRVRIGGALAPVSVWTNTSITGTVPGISSGTQPVVVERAVTGALAASDTFYFDVVLPSITGLTPSSAPIGAPFTVRGSGFGPYNATYTKVLIGGIAAPVSVWNDTTITGNVPGAVASGSTTLVVQRTNSGGLAAGATDFLVLVPHITQMAPISGQPGDAFELQGAGFGPYKGSATKVTFSGVAAPLSLWTDTVIHGLVPQGLAVGTYTVVAALTPTGGSVQSNAAIYGVGTEGMGVLGVGSMAASRRAPRPSWYYQASLDLPSEEGGQVTAPSHASVIVPPLALDTTTSLTIDRGPVLGPDSEARVRILSAVSMAAAGEPVQFGPESLRFAVPVTIELPYDPASILLGKDGLVAVHYWDPAAKTWTALPSEVDTLHHRVRARTDHFSLYQPLVPGSASPASATTAFGLIDVYAFPNPSRGRQGVTIRAQVGLADQVDVSIYDVTGRQVNSGSVLSPNILDDNNGKGPQYTFDYPWDTSGAGSGVYIYLVTAKTAGAGPIRKQGKVGVIK